MLETIIISLATGAVSALVAWFKATSTAKKVAASIAAASRYDKVIGIGRTIAAELAPIALGYAADLAKKTDWKWDDALVAEANRRITGQSEPPLAPEEKQMLRDVFNVPPATPEVVAAAAEMMPPGTTIAPPPSPKLDAATMAKLREKSR